MTGNKKKKLGLSTTIFLSLLLGAVFGLVLHYAIPAGSFRDEVLIEGILITWLQRVSKGLN